MKYLEVGIYKARKDDFTCKNSRIDMTTESGSSNLIEMTK